MDAETLLTQALERIESPSIKAWATSEHNRPIFIKIAESALKKNPQTDALQFSTYITCQAIGL